MVYLILNGSSPILSLVKETIDTGCLGSSDLGQEFGLLLSVVPTGGEKQRIFPKGGPQRQPLTA